MMAKRYDFAEAAHPLRRGRQNGASTSGPSAPVVLPAAPSLPRTPDEGAGTPAEGALLSLDAADLEALLALMRARTTADARRQTARVRALLGHEARHLEPHFEALLARLSDLQQARHLAATDALTGVANRRAFGEALQRELARAARSGQPLSVLLLDIDGFKAINDGYSHAEGDRALRLFARSALRATRKGDLVARIGGDEFAVVLPMTDADEARAIGERIRERARNASRKGPPVHASMGVAVTRGEVVSGHTLLAAADRGLYQDKEERRSSRPAVPGAPGAALPVQAVPAAR